MISTKLSGQLENSPCTLRVMVTGPSLHDVGGVANFLKLMVEHIDRATVDILYIAVGRSSNQTPWWYRPFDYLYSISRFIRALLTFHPDLIHINPSLTWRSLPLNLGLLLIAKIVARRPIIVFFHGWSDAIATNLQPHHLLGGVIRRILMLADYYLVLSCSFREMLLRAGFSSECVEVTSPIVDLSMFSNQVEERIYINEQNRPFKVLFLSRIEKDKGVQELSNAIRWFHQNHPEAPIEFIIAGSGTEEKLIKTDLQQEISNGLVKMPGYLLGSEKVKVYQKADLYVFPSSHDEGFPATILEAMAAALPLIYTPVGALKEVLGPENGMCIQLDDLSGITLGNAIWMLYQEPGWRMAMSQVNQRLVKERYDGKSVCSQMVDIYQRLIKLGC